MIAEWLASLGVHCMPNFKTPKWNGYEVRLAPFREDRRSKWLIFWFPYFWDSDCCFDMWVRQPKERRGEKDVISWAWQLKDLDDNVIKQGSGTLHLPKEGIRRFLSYWSGTKARAVPLGTLAPNRQYKVLLQLFSEGTTDNETFEMVTFTTKDRDEVYMQAFIAVFAVATAFAISILERACLR